MALVLVVWAACASEAELGGGLDDADASAARDGDTGPEDGGVPDSDVPDVLTSTDSADVDTEVVENRDIYDPATDTYTDWPYTGPLAEECWRFTPSIPGEDVALNTTGLAVDGEVVYLHTASRQRDEARSFLHAITADGVELWHVETWDMMIPLPTIIDDAGDLLLVAQSYSLPWRDLNGVRVQKWSKGGVKLWERLGDAYFEDLVYTYDRQLASYAAAIDDQNNLYFVTGAFLRSVDGETGEPRWHHDMVPDGALNTGGDIASPTIVDNLVYMVDDDYSLVVLDTEGEVVLKRKGLFAEMRPRWMFASRAGFLFAPAFGAGLVTFTGDGEILGFEVDGHSEAKNQSVVSDELGVIYSQDIFGHGMRALTSDFTPVWTSPGWPVTISDGIIVDTEGRLGVKGFFDEKLTVVDRRTGERIFDEHPLAVTYGQPVLARPGEVIMVARYPGVDRAHVKCVVAPLGVPDPHGWSTPHANFKNQRRVHTSATR